MRQSSFSTSKTRITIRIDDDILDWFRAQAAEADGGSYQALINKALREYMRNLDTPIEEILRRVIREELVSTRGAQNTPPPVTFKGNTRLPG